MAAIRVLLVDDESLVRVAVKGILAAHEDIEVVGEAATGDEAVSSVERLQPHVVGSGYTHAENGWSGCRT